MFSGADGAGHASFLMASLFDAVAALPLDAVVVGVVVVVVVAGGDKPPDTRVSPEFCSEEAPKIQDKKEIHISSFTK